MQGRGSTNRDQASKGKACRKELATEFSGAVNNKNSTSSCDHQCRLKQQAEESLRTMCGTRGAWIVAASVGAVEALKDQGFGRWSYTMRSVHQHAKSNVRSFLQAKELSPSSSAMVLNKLKSEKKNQAAEDSLRKVMYLSCWGP
ncbi:hypothetical protein ACFX2J_023798 [Malus domestica]|uniref:Wound-responsive family protein n=2 Tax=Maleae TaxID=721813 RepID=A0A498H9L4_MALDO|nr:hypothetical protein DVH24_028273 [Malus domestica]